MIKRCLDLSDIIHNMLIVAHMKMPLCFDKEKDHIQEQLLLWLQFPLIQASLKSTFAHQSIFIFSRKSTFTALSNFILTFMTERKLAWQSSIKFIRKIFQKTNISNPLICTQTCAYQGVRNVNFSENFA